MNSVETWVDPLCPWAWVTSRWPVEVERLGEVEVQFRVVCKDYLNPAANLPAALAAIGGVAFFGPVLTPGFYELKRSHDGDPQFN